MPRTALTMRHGAPWIAALLLGSALGGCDMKGAPDVAPSDSGSAEADATPDALPLTTAGPTTQAVAPPVTALPAGQAIGLRPLADRQQGYGYLDQAYYQESAVENAPPDYGFDADGVRPWTWTSGDGARVISEPVAGGYRTYYYEAGAQQPYLVRDPSYSYAYDNGALVAVYTLAGLLTPVPSGSAQALYGARYFERGGNLWHGAQSAPHLAVNAYAWSDRRADLSAQRVTWQSHLAANPDWAAWNRAHSATEQTRWDTVRVQHQAAAQQFGTWQQHKFKGAPPALYAPPTRPEDIQPDHPVATHQTGVPHPVDSEPRKSEPVAAAHETQRPATPEHALAGHAAPAHETQHPAAPEHAAPQHPAPEHPAPEHSAPAHEAPRHPGAPEHEHAEPHRDQ